MTRGKRWNVVKQKKIQNQLSHLLLFLPFAVIFTVFKIIPILSATVLSFTDFNLVNIRHFRGLRKLLRILFADDIFIPSLKNTLILALITGPLGFIPEFHRGLIDQ